MFEQDVEMREAYEAGARWASMVGYRESPLSGEWAGESIPELSDMFGVDLFDTDVADQFEFGFASYVVEGMTDGSES